LGVLAHAKGEAGHDPSGWSPREMRGSRLELSGDPERGIPPSDQQHPTAPFPREADKRKVPWTFRRPNAKPLKGEGVATKCRRKPT